MKLLTVILIIMSIVSFAAMGIDKSKAQRGKWRISEKMLFLLALSGGAVGGTLGMWVFHHKTRHWYFKFGFPILATAQIILVYFI